VEMIASTKWGVLLSHVHFKSGEEIDIFTRLKRKKTPNRATDCCIQNHFSSSACQTCFENFCDCFVQKDTTDKFNLL
jgi:hypothetical protein